MTHARAAIVASGDEIILGQTSDTNSRWLADRLASLGVPTVEFAAVGDDRGLLARTLARLAAAADLVVVTGGLGPTADDLTRSALADALGDALVEDPAALAQVREYFRARGRDMPDLNRVQAQRPSRARCLPNPVGTAPGLHATLTAAPDRLCDVFCLPGPPPEMHPMFESFVVPALRADPARLIATRAVHCVGIGESDLATRLGPLMARDANPLIGTTASRGVVSARIRYIGPATGARASLDRAEDLVRRAAGHFVFGIDADSLASAILSLLRARSETLAVVESCTGGGLAHALTDIPGSSDAFVGGLVTYSNDLKSRLAGVPPETLAAHGAVSRETALAMAKGGLDRTDASHCLAITGVAGPRGGTPDKPVGAVWIARASRTGPPADAREFRFLGDRASVREWACISALAMLRQHLAGLPPARLLREV